MIPKPIYEILPFAYALIGIGSIGYFYNTPSSAIGIFSGVVFVLTAILVYRLRQDNRRFDYKVGNRR